MSNIVKQSVTYAYDAGFRLATVTEGGYDTTYTYDQNGNRLSLYYEETDSMSYYAYNQANMIIVLQNYCEYSMQYLPDQMYTYTYYLDGNQETYSKGIEHIEPLTVISYSYDGAGRLTAENEYDFMGMTYSYAYQYDHAGNRTGMAYTYVTGSDPGSGSYTYSTENTYYTYNKANQLLTETKGITTTAYTYDFNGNLLERDDGAAEEIYGYDVKNRQIYNYKSYYEMRYSYRPDGLRAMKGEGTNTEYSYIWDGMNLVYELYEEPEFYTEYERIYVYGINLIKSYVEQYDSSVNEHYYFYNSHGDVTGLVNAFTGHITKNYQYDAFGNEKSPSGSDMNPFRYCGEYWDSETRTYYLRARYYDPKLGRFLTADTHWNVANMIYGDDPVQLNGKSLPNRNAYMQSLNLYAYCMSNPVMYVDPTGKIVITISIMGIVKAVVTGISMLVVVVASHEISEIVGDEIKAPSKSISKISNNSDIPNNLGDFNDNKKSHILKEKHKWSKLVPNPEDPNNWGKIATIISTVLANGTEEKYKGAADVFIKTYQIGKEIVQVTYKIIDGIIHISDAWVQ